MRATRSGLLMQGSRWLLDSQRCTEQKLYLQNRFDRLLFVLPSFTTVGRRDGDIGSYFRYIELLHVCILKEIKSGTSGFAFLDSNPAFCRNCGINRCSKEIMFVILSGAD